MIDYIKAKWEQFEYWCEKYFRANKEFQGY